MKSLRKMFTVVWILRRSNEHVLNIRRNVRKTNYCRQRSLVGESQINTESHFYKRKHYRVIASMLNKMLTMTGKSNIYTLAL